MVNTHASLLIAAASCVNMVHGESLQNDNVETFSTIKDGIEQCNNGDTYTAIITKDIEWSEQVNIVSGCIVTLTGNRSSSRIRLDATSSNSLEEMQTHRHIYNEGTLVLDSVRVRGGIAYYSDTETEPRKFKGGAIYSTGDVIIRNSIVNDNLAHAEGGAIYLFSGQLSVRDSEFNHNVAQNAGGGAIMSRSSDVATIYNTVFDGNRAVDGGGSGAAIRTWNFQTNVDVRGCTFTDNQSINDASTIMIKGGKFSVGSSTFTGNKIDSDDMYDENDDIPQTVIAVEEGTLTVHSATFIDNGYYDEGVVTPVISLYLKRGVNSASTINLPCGTAEDGIAFQGIMTDKFEQNIQWGTCSNGYADFSLTGAESTLFKTPPLVNWNGVYGITLDTPITCNSLTCESCHYGYELMNGTCSECQGEVLVSQYYTTEGECTLADCSTSIDGCGTCNNIGDTCDSCLQSYLFNNSCVDTCPSGTRKNDEVATKYCEDCEARSCDKCDDDASVCTKCRPEFYLYDSPAVGANICVTTCPAGSGVKAATSDADTNACVPCNDQKCVTCSDDMQMCGECKTDYFLIHGATKEDDTQCVKECPTKQAVIPGTQTCGSCETPEAYADLYFVGKGDGECMYTTDAMQVPAILGGTIAGVVISVLLVGGVAAVFAIRRYRQVQRHNTNKRLSSVAAIHESDASL